MYGIAIMNTIQTVGTMTPARPLSMCSSSSCRLSRYHGAFDGFGVQSGVLWSWSGALNAAEMMNRPMNQSIAAMNSMTSRCGQTIAVSSTRLSTRTTESWRTNARSRRRFSWPEKGCGPRGVVIYYSGPEMPPSLRIRQKWMAMRNPVASGNATTWST